MPKNTDDISTKAIDAFDAGVEAPPAELPPIEEEDDNTEIVEELDADGNPVVPPDDEGGDEGEPELDADGNPVEKAPAAKPAEKVAAKPKDDKAKPADDPKAAKVGKDAKADEADAKALGLEGKTKERFVTMASTIREQGTELGVYREQFGALGVDFKAPPEKIKEQIGAVAAAARDQFQWDEHMAAIKAQPEQFGQAMGALAAINSEDPAQWKQARDFMAAEIKLLDKRLGVKTDDYNPLDEFPDIKAKVESGKMDEEDALAWVADKKQSTARATADTKRQTDQQHTTLIETATAKVRETGAALRTRDGDAAFEARMAVVQPLLASHFNVLPPDQWAAKAAELYEAAAKTVKAPAVRVAPGGRQPLRQNHQRAGTVATIKQPTSAMDAFDVGLEEAKAQGY